MNTYLLSKSSRDYIKNWGRTAANKHIPQTIQNFCNGLFIGDITAQWSDDSSDFVWGAIFSFTPGTAAQCFASEDEATKYMIAQYYIVMESATFCKWVKIMMKRHKMTQKGLAEHLGISRVSVNHWVTGKRECTLQHWHLLSVLFAGLEQMPHTQMLGHMCLLYRGKSC
jgi:DNA-binding transcriptional regulator YiaG